MSKKYLIIDNDTVENIIVLDHISTYKTYKTLVEIDDAVIVEVGYSYNFESKELSAPVKPITQQEINSNAYTFLNSTDWMIIRALEKGEELSPEFKAERQAARDSIVKG